MESEKEPRHPNLDVSKWKIQLSVFPSPDRFPLRVVWTDYEAFFYFVDYQILRRVEVTVRTYHPVPDKIQNQPGYGDSPKESFLQYRAVLRLDIPNQSYERGVDAEREGVGILPTRTDAVRHLYVKLVLIE